MKVLIFGAGENARFFLKHNPVASKVVIMGIMDNDNLKWGEKLNDFTIESPEIMRTREWDKIIITPNCFEEIASQIENQYGVVKTKLIKISDLIIPEESNMGTVRLQCDYDDCYEISDLVPDKIIPSNKMEEFYLKKSHRIMNKWWHYFEVYHTFFHKYIGTDVKILEIGVFKGGSMQMWKDYFGEKAVIVGIDIDEKCKAFEEDNVRICIGSQADKDFLTDVSETWGPFDIVLDDGSHVMEHQIITFETLFPLLKEGGVFVCEDCHTSYLSSFGGGYKKKESFMEYSKNFIDCVNSQHVNCREKDRLPSYAEHIKACHYYDSIVVVEKEHRGISIVTEFEQ